MNELSGNSAIVRQLNSLIYSNEKYGAFLFPFKN